jgi:hypothetical protein
MTLISYFNTAEDTTPKDRSLDEWLKMTISPPENLEALVLKYRETQLRKDKVKIPCITISSRLEGHRNLDSIVEKTGFIAIDIDRFSKSKKKKSNRCVDMLLVKELFMEHPCCYYSGFSCGGDGVYAIFKIDPEIELIEYFNYFEESLSRVGLNIDESCKDYTRLRFFSIDKEAYYNPNAKVLKIKPKEQEEEKPKEQEPEFKPQTRERAAERLSNWEKAKKVVELIEQTSIDITSSYDDWVKIAGALNNEFGHDGNSLFHRLSSFHPDYKWEEVNKKYKQCSNMTKVSFSTFLYIANSYGIRY